MQTSGYMMVICARWIDEVAGTRCVLEKGHDGPCKAKGQTDGRD